MRGYPIELTPDDNGTLLVTCPDLPEVTSFGVDEADAIARARCSRGSSREPHQQPASGTSERAPDRHALRTFRSEA
jgi:hypothetical protein